MVLEAAFTSASISQPRSSSLRCFRAGLLLRPQFRPCNHHCHNCLADLPAFNPQSCPHTLLGAAPSVWSCRPWTVPSAPAAPSPLQDASVTLGWGTSGRWHRQHRSTSTGGSFWPSPAAGPRPSRQTTLSISPRAGVLLGATQLPPKPPFLSACHPSSPRSGLPHPPRISGEPQVSLQPPSSLLPPCPDAAQAPALTPLTHSSGSRHPNPRESTLLERGRAPPSLPAEQTLSLPPWTPASALLSAAPALGLLWQVHPFSQL